MEREANSNGGRAFGYLRTSRRPARVGLGGGIGAGRFPPLPVRRRAAGRFCRRKGAVWPGRLGGIRELPSSLKCFTPRPRGSVPATPSCATPDVRPLIREPGDKPPRRIAPWHFVPGFGQLACIFSAYNTARRTPRQLVGAPPAACRATPAIWLHGVLARRKPPSRAPRRPFA